MGAFSFFSPPAPFPLLFRVLQYHCNPNAHSRPFAPSTPLIPIIPTPPIIPIHFFHSPRCHRASLLRPLSGHSMPAIPRSFVPFLSACLRPSSVCRDSVATIPLFSFVRRAGIYVRHSLCLRPAPGRLRPPSMGCPVPGAFAPPKSPPVVLSATLRRSLGDPSTKSL